MTFCWVVLIPLSILNLLVTGFLIRVGVTVVWGIHPAHAAEIINEFGNIDRVLDKVNAETRRREAATLSAVSDWAGRAVMPGWQDCSRCWVGFSPDSGARRIPLRPMDWPGH